MGWLVEPAAGEHGESFAIAQALGHGVSVGRLVSRESVQPSATALKMRLPWAPEEAATPTHVILNSPLYGSITVRSLF